MFMRSPSSRRSVSPADQFPPTSSGIVKPNWTVETLGGNHPFAAYNLVEPDSEVMLGQMLSFPESDTQPNWANRRTHDGYRWSATPFPDHFKMIPLDEGHKSSISAASTWYKQQWLSAMGAPAAPNTTDTIWRIRHKPAGTEEDVGYLIRLADGSSLRWVILGSKVRVVGTKRALPDGTLKLDRVSEADYAGSSYEQSTEEKVS